MRRVRGEHGATTLASLPFPKVSRYGAGLGSEYVFLTGWQAFETNGTLVDYFCV
jgi:hypothetical protein